METYGWIAVIILAGLLLGFFLKRRHRSRILPVFERLACEYDGEIDHRLLSSTRLVLVEDGRAFCVFHMQSGTTGGSQPLTCADGEISVGREVDFRLISQAALSKIPAKQWEGYVLDGSFQLSPADHFLSQQWSSEQLAERLERWEDVGLDITLKDGRLTVSVHRHLYDEDDLKQLIGLFQRLSRLLVREGPQDTIVS